MSPSRQDDFDELYRAHGGRLVAQLYAHTQDLPLAEDLVQEAFCRALARWGRISRYEDPVGWIRRVAWNLAVSNWRRGRHRSPRDRAEPVVAGPSPEHIALVQALATLPVPQRRAVIMYYLGDLPVAEIAGIEGASENTVKQRLHRARAALATQLDDRRPEVDSV